MSGRHAGRRSAPLRLRAARTSDAERLGRAVSEGLEGYESFAPADWSPPTAAGEAEHLHSLLADQDVWCLLAEAGGRVVGQVTVLPAARAARPSDDPAVAHLRNLVVASDHRGTGLARTLHQRAVAAARSRGYARMRLFVAADHRRARRFYEREGWTAAGDAFLDSGLGLLIVECRYELRRA